MAAVTGHNLQTSPILELLHYIQNSKFP